MKLVLELYQKGDSQSERLLKDSKPVDSDMLNDDAVVSFDKDGEIVSIEIWRAKELILPVFLKTSSLSRR